MQEELELFPYETARKEQTELLKDIYEAAEKGKCLIANAPTGLGKTAAALAPTLNYAIKNNHTVFFLTSRHTQHTIAIETLKQIKEKHKTGFTAADIAGKRNMCAQENASGLPSKQFHEYCNSIKEEDQCQFYTNLKKKGELSDAAKRVVEELKKEITDTEKTGEISKLHGICPYEAAMAAAKDASAIIADYYYIFHPEIREGFLKKTGKKLDEAIIIVDEAHNLPERMREMLTERTSTTTAERALNEAEKYAGDEEKEFLAELRNTLIKLAGKDQKEKIIAKEQLTETLGDIEAIMRKLSAAAEAAREAKKQSYIGSIIDFVSAWQGENEGHARIISRKQGYKGEIVTLSYQCLDPGTETKKVIEQARTTILMSGTLTPTKMYKETMGFPDNTMEKEYKSPFPEKNRLPLIIPDITTKFTKRSPEQYKKISELCINTANEIPGNTAIFFPSYSIMEEVHTQIHEKTGKKIFTEKQNMTKAEKEKLLSEFRHAYLTGGLLLAVIGGNFNEGIDLPGELLNGVVIIGLPLTQPDLKTQQLINHYDKKYGKGWDYGYIYPAFTKALQSAGRCIRSETDKGTIIFADERYTWPRYHNCFPKEMKPKVTAHYKEEIRQFFSSTQTGLNGY